MTATRWSGRADPQACGASPCARRRSFSHDIMRSAAVPKPAENLHSDDTTPHNATLRIIGSADEDSVAWSFVVGGAGFGGDADAFGLQAEGDDLALEIVSDLLERTDGSHVTSPVVFRARDHRGLDGDLQAEDDRRRTRSGRSAAEDAVVETFLPREEWALAQGKKVLSDGVAAQTIEA